jgi:hypothetical protein
VRLAPAGTVDLQTDLASGRLCGHKINAGKAGRSFATRGGQIQEIVRGLIDLSREIDA